MIKIGCMSDLHGYVHGLSGKSYPDVELLIIAGDIPGPENVREQEKWFTENMDVLRDPHIFPDLQEIYIVPGNHDYWLERNYQSPIKVREILGPGVSVLVDQEKTFTSWTTGESVTIWGNPRTSLWSFAFPHLAGNLDLQIIPRDGSIGILVTHEAPRLYELGCIKGTLGNWDEGDKPGNLALAQTSLEVKPRYHVFGHIHWPEKKVIQGITFMNVSQQKRPGDIYTPEVYVIDYD